MTTKKYILAIDQGTTGTTVCLINLKGQIAFKGYQEFPQYFPKPGWVEHDLDEIWKSFLKALKQVLSQSKISTQNIISIGITNQRETVGAWDRKTQKPLHKAIVWQCRRTAPFCESLRKKGLEKIIQKKTGLLLDPYFSASKMKWLLQTGLKKNKNLNFGTIDAYLLFKLTNAKSYKTDVSNASRTQLMNLKTLSWDKDLLKIFGIPEISLPEITPNTHSFGVSEKVPGLPDGIPITGMIGDQQSALLGQTCFSKGDVKCTFGTGSFVLLNTGDEILRSQSGLLSTVAWNINQKTSYALEGGSFVCGALVQWLRDGLGLISSSSEIESLALKEPSSEGVVIIPSLTGLGAPYWTSHTTGLITGLTRNTNRSHIARACLEAMAFQNVDLLKAMKKDLGKPLKNIRVDGGACMNNLLLQTQADLLGQTLQRPQNIESTSLGAGFLSGLGAGVWKDFKDIKKITQNIDKKFSPKISSKLRHQKLQTWKKAISKTLLGDTTESHFKKCQKFISS